MMEQMHVPPRACLPDVAIDLEQADQARDDEPDVPEALTCVVCGNILCRSRMFEECGHTFCSFCLMRNDYACLDETRAATDYPLFRCPVCRSGSLRRWHERPLNVLVNQLAAEHPAHARRELEVEVEMRAWIDGHAVRDDTFGVMLASTRDDARGVNLAMMAVRARAAKARTFYEAMLPVLMDAAAAGLCKVSFTTRAREINAVMSCMRELLFRHGIHSVHSTSRETTVYFTHDDLEWGSSFVNPLYDEAAITRYDVPAASPPASPSADEAFVEF